MQDKINSFNAAFVDLAAAYVKHVKNKMAGATTHAPEVPGGPLCWGMSLADEIRAANLMAATIGKMQAASGGEFPQDEQEDGKPHTAAGNPEFLRDFLEGKTRWTFPEGATFNVTIDASSTSGMETTLKSAEKEPPARPEPVVKLGPGASFQQENTPIHGQYAEPQESANADVLPVLNNLCGFCRAAAKHGGVTPEREWSADAAALQFAISVLSELREIKEVRIPAEPNTPGAWELMRDILAGKWKAPEGTVFDVVIDMTGNPQAIRNREEPEPAPRALAIAMPGGETVKLNSAAEAYRLAGCIEDMTARVWPEAVPGK